MLCPMTSTFTACSDYVSGYLYPMDLKVHNVFCSEEEHIEDDPSALVAV